MALKDGKDGEEKYTSKDLGEIMIDCVNKRKARQLIKKQIREELRNEL